MTSGVTGRFEGMVGLVFGGSTGIGAAVVRRLAGEGARVLLADIDELGARALVESIDPGGLRLRAIHCDIGDEAEIAAACRMVVEAFGGVDAVLVNAADVRIAELDTDALSVPMEVFDRTIAINLRGHLLATRQALPLLLERGGGAIVYTSSRAGLTSEPTRVSYAVSKAGLHALMRHVALKWGKDGVRANVVAPGTTLTETLCKLGEEFIQSRLRSTPSPRLGTPEDIAGVIAFLLSDDAAFVNGQVISADGGVTMR
jgi:NAD(P)-dependent dehydrogenase (short-subunit alcohol dehydrogenase family)